MGAQARFGSPDAERVSHECPRPRAVRTARVQRRVHSLRLTVNPVKTSHRNTESQKHRHSLGKAKKSFSVFLCFCVCCWLEFARMWKYVALVAFAVAGL